MNRPFKDRRPVGPFIDLDSEDNTVEEPEAQTQTANASQQIDDPILETAENWYQSISKEKNKRKMMKNYLNSITDLSDSEITRKLDEAGL